MLLYHGSKEIFSAFCPSFYRSGEGVGNYEGWHFCSTPKGALYHCEKYLECRPHGIGGSIYVCAVEDEYIDHDIDGCYTEHPYGRPIYGVLLKNTHHVKIIERLDAFYIFEKIYGKVELDQRNKDKLKNGLL